MKRLLLLSFTLMSGYAFSQQKEKGVELLQLVKLAEVYRNANNLSFSVTYTYADSTAPSTYLEQMNGTTRISNGKYWSMIDSVEMLQGNYYRLSAYLRDSTIIISDRLKYDDMFRLPLLDAAFRTANVAATSIYQQNDSTWSFTVNFNPSSGYSKYVLVYDPRNFRLKQVQYFIRNAAKEDGSGVMTGLITMKMTNYSTAVIDPSLFNEERFAIKVNGVWTVRPQFGGYYLINNSSN